MSKRLRPAVTAIEFEFDDTPQLSFASDCRLGKNAQRKLRRLAETGKLTTRKKLRVGTRDLRIERHGDGTLLVKNA